MSKDGEAALDIIAEMKASLTTYRLKASQLADLRDQGVSDDVINYMQQTYTDSVERRAELENWDHWNMEEGWWYGGPAWGWPDEWY